MKRSINHHHLALIATFKPYLLVSFGYQWILLHSICFRSMVDGGGQRSEARPSPERLDAQMRHLTGELSRTTSQLARTVSQVSCTCELWQLIFVFITEQSKIIIIGRRHDRVLQSCLRYQGSCRVQHQDSGRTQGQSPACCQKHPWGNQGNEERLHHERWQIYWYSQEDLWPHVSYSLLGSFYSILSSSFSQLQFLQILGCDEWRTSVAGESWPHLRPQLSASTATSAPDTTTANDPATVGQTDTKHDGSSIRQYVSR